MTVHLWIPLLLASLGVAQAQDAVVATSSSGQATSLVAHPAMVVFVTSSADNLQEAAKNAAISEAQGHAIAAVAAHALPIPVVGGFIGEQVVGRILKLHHPEVKGFNLAFVQGLSAQTLLQEGNFTFTVPAQSLQGTTPVLLRVRSSVKESARIVRGVHIVTKMTGSSINPLATRILGVDQEAVACRQEIRDGNVVLIPDSALERGEYALALVPTPQDIVPVGLLWDFRVI